MGLIQAAVGSIAGTLADQWVDFYTVPLGIGHTAAIFPAVPAGQNTGRGSNIRFSEGVITNGSKIIVPEGYSLLTVEDGKLTSLVTAPGAYVWDTDAQSSKSIFRGDDLVSTLASESWERFRYGGRPSSQQLALFVSKKELPNNRFGTQTPIYWDDSFLRSQVGAMARGTFGLKIIDPVKLVTNFVPASVLQNQEVFDFTDIENDYSNQIFNEVVSSLALALSYFANDNNRIRRISSIQSNIANFSSYLSQAVQDVFKWESERGLILTKATLIGIDYDERTREMLGSIQRADALSGERGDSNLKASLAAGIEEAGNKSGSSGLLGIGLAAGTFELSSIVGKPTSSERESGKETKASNDLFSRLEEIKRAYDAGLISEDEFQKAKSKELGL